MKIHKVILSLLLSLVASFSYAGEWFFKGVTIQDVTFLHSNSKTAVIIKISSTEAPPNRQYSCPATAGRQIVAYWADGTTDFTLGLLSTAMSAQAQGLEVDINVDLNDCSTATHWWDGVEPHGLGLQLLGIRIKQ